MAKFFGLGSKTPVKIAFQIHVQEIKPWMSMTTMTMQGGISSTPAIILSWTQGEKRSGSTKPIQPSSGKIIFNEEFKLSVTMLEKTGKQKREWESKYLLFTLHDLSLPSQSSSTQQNSTTLASAELDLSKVINLEERMTTFTIPLNVRGGGGSSQGSSNNPSAAAAPILSLRISAQVVKAVALFNSSMIKGTWRPSSSSASTNVKTNVQARNNNATSIEDLEIDSFTDDDDDSPRTSTGSTKEVENKAELNRKKLFETQSPVPKSNSNSGLNLRAPPGKSAPAADEAPGHATAAAAALPTTSGLAAAAPTASAGTGKVVQEAAAAAAAATTSGKLDFAATTASATSTVTSSTSVAPVARVWNSATSLVTVATAPAQQGAVEVSEKAWTAAPAAEEYKRSSSGPGLGWDSELVAASSDQAAAGSSSYRSVLGEARAKLAMVEKRALEELRTKVAAAEAKAAMNQEKGEEKATQLEQELKKLEDELRDSAAIEVALFSIVAEHVGSPHKLHTPARRLARLYVHTFRNRSSDRCINSAKNYAAGLIVAVRACGNDVARLTYWWSNVVVLRESIMQACNVDELSAATIRRHTELSSTSETRPAVMDLQHDPAAGGGSSGGSSELRATAGLQQQRRYKSLDAAGGAGRGTILDSSAECSSSCHDTLVATLYRIEAWLQRRVLECVWWQAMTPVMQMPEPRKTKTRTSSLSQMNLGDDRQGSISTQIWKTAFQAAYRLLCPLQAGEHHDCGCLPILSKMIISQCVERLDVVLFNGIMRSSKDDSCADLLADPITNLSVLPIPVGTLTFGAGAQLKNVVVTWSTWLTALLNVKAEDSTAITETTDTTSNNRETASDTSSEKAAPYFVLLRAVGDLLMLPKDMLMDKSVRKEVCPTLDLIFIRRILFNFQPDEFSPDPISPALLGAINSEVSIQRQMHGEVDMRVDTVAIAPLPPILYSPPSSNFVRLWIGEPHVAIDDHHWGYNSVSSLLCKGYNSDDELEEFQTPLAWLKDNNYSQKTSSLTSSSTLHGSMTSKNSNLDASMERGASTSRYQLLREAWKEG
ncbi:unnamed protein product [Sphagnum compactum]